MNITWRGYLLEAIGTYLVVGIGAGTLCTTYLTPYQTVGGTPLAVALAEGLTLAAVLTWTTLASPGCCNPAVALALWLVGKLRLSVVSGLIMVQLAGGFLAGATVRFLFADAVLTDARLGTPHLGAILGREGIVTFAALTTGFFLELLFTTVVILSALTTLVHPRRPQVGGLLVGLTQVAVILFGFHLTGGSANPARWLGPALWLVSVSGIESPFADHVVYWSGPAVGAMIAGVLYSRAIGETGTR
ncbi:MAG: aquaporin [Gemmataceae bacterium]